MHVQKPDRGLNLQSITRRRGRWLLHSEARTLTITLGGEDTDYYTRRRGRWLLHSEASTLTITLGGEHAWLSHSEATTLPMLIIVFRVQSQCNYIYLLFINGERKYYFRFFHRVWRLNRLLKKCLTFWHAWTKWLQTIRVWFEILHFHNKIKFMKQNKIYDAKQSVLPIFLVFCVAFFVCFVCLRPGSCCVKCCQCLWIVHYWLPLWFPPNVYVYR